MKRNIKLSNIKGYELKKDEINSIVAGEAGLCDYACGCSCSCDTGNEYQANNTADTNASNTESAGFAQEGTAVAVAVIIAIIW